LVVVPTGKVFLSYASEDSAAAETLASALRQAGIQVWFDKSELRGGDAWGRRIREEIRSCSLFIPVISAHTEARDEGYFRREWKLAVDRMQDMAEEKPFLLPIVIDDTREAGASVPEVFCRFHWTRTSGRVVPAALVSRVIALASKQSSVTEGAADRVPKEDHRRKPKSPGSWIGIAGGSLLAVVCLLYLLISVRRQDLATTDPAAAPSDLVRTPSIAILPFKDLSEKHDQEYFADGLAEELIDQLTKVPSLAVTARKSSFHFKNESASLAHIGQMLRVAYILEGSVRETDSRLRNAVQLIRANDERSILSRTYERPGRCLRPGSNQSLRGGTARCRASLAVGSNLGVGIDRPCLHSSQL
jgi:TolB-like protein